MAIGQAHRAAPGPGSTASLSKAPTAEQRAALASQAMSSATRTSSHSSSSGVSVFVYLFSVLFYFPPAIHILIDCNTDYLESRFTFIHFTQPTAEQRAQLAAMAMQNARSTAGRPTGAPSAEDRARLAAMAMRACVLNILTCRTRAAS